MSITNTQSSCTFINQNKSSIDNNDWILTNNGKKRKIKHSSNESLSSKSNEEYSTLDNAYKSPSNNSSYSENITWAPKKSSNPNNYDYLLNTTTRNLFK